MTRPDIYFLHIPKTAGTSFASLIRQPYQVEEVFPVHEWNHLVSMRLEDINRYRCYTGHFGTSLYSLLDRPIPTVTVLRDPFERTVSHIWHLERATGKRLSATEWLRSVWLRDVQMYSLGLEIDLKPFLGTKDTRDYLSLLYQTRKGMSPETVLELAKRRLDSMAVVGTVERFAESVALICAFLGVSLPDTLPEENVAPGHSVASRYRNSGEIPPQLIARIDEITAYDRQLYDYANQLLDKQIRETATSGQENLTATETTSLTRETITLAPALKNETTKTYGIWDDCALWDDYAFRDDPTFDNTPLWDGYDIRDSYIVRDDYTAWETYEKQQARKLVDGFHLVLGPPKAGTTTLIHTLGTLNLPGYVDSVHALSEALLLGGFLWGDPRRDDFPMADKAFQLRRHWFVGTQLDIYQKLQQQLATVGMATREPRPHILVPLREPVARYLSEIYYQDFYEHSRVTVTPEIAGQAMRQKYHPLGGHYWWAIEDWIRLEVQSRFGVDVFAEPFDTERGWQIYERENVRLLVIRQESLKSLADALGTFYGLVPETIFVPGANVGEENEYGEAYRLAKDAVRLPRELLDEVYSCLFCQHFYTEVERQKFIQRWVE